MGDRTEDIFETCAKCGKNQNNVSNLNDMVFLVNICGHKFCPSCVKQEFHKKRQFSCPRCAAVVTEDKLSSRSIEEIEAEKDVGIRRSVKKVFNKTEEDFPNINDYKDYEEMIEDIIYNIVRGINVPEMEEKIEKYKQENARAITLKFSELQKRDKEEMILIREEESKRAKRETEAAELLKSDMLSKKKLKTQMNQMMLGETPQNNNTGGSFNVPNPLTSLLSSRPLPKEVPKKTKPNPVLTQSNEQLRKLHQAGGYEFSNYDKRNWTDIRSQLVALSHNR